MHLWDSSWRGCSSKFKRKIILRLNKPHHDGVAWTSFSLTGDGLDFFPHGALHLRFSCSDLLFRVPSDVLLLIIVLLELSKTMPQVIFPARATRIHCQST